MQAAPTATPANSEEQQPWLLRLLPSLTDLAFLTPLFFLFAVLRGAKTMLGDGDTGWHIRTGEWILAHGAVPRVDMFSFSKPGQTWFAWEWGWDVLFALVHARWGLTGVVFINMLLLGLMAVLLFRLVRAHTSNDIVAYGITLLAMLVSSLHWLARPHLIGWFLLLISCHILRRARNGNPRALWWMPLLIALWTNLHGSFFIGIALVVVYGAGDVLRAAIWENAAGFRRALRDAMPYAVVTACCGAATFLNPYGVGLHQHVIAYLRDSKQLDQISEFQSVSFHSPLAVGLEIMLFLAAAGMCWCWGKRRIADLLILAAWAHLALVSNRNIPIFVFLAAPLAAAMLDDVFAQAKNSSSRWLAALGRVVRDGGAEFREMDRAWRVHVPIGLAAVVLALCFAAPIRPTSLIAEYDRHDYPTAALDVLRNKATSRIFTDDEWGDFLIYQLYPKYQVFIDGRSDFYGADMDTQELQIIGARYDWQEKLSRYGIDTVLMRADAPLAGVLKEAPGWSLVFDDGVSTVFRLRSPVPTGIAREKLSSVSTDVGKRPEALAALKPDVRTLKPKKTERRS